MIRIAKILVVDDEARNRHLLEVFLKADGFEVVQASSGAEALVLAATAIPDAVLLDLMMPDMDGFQVVRRLRESPGTRHIPVIIVSALDDLAARQRVLTSGADDFIGKPIDRWELSMRLHRLLKADELASLPPVPSSSTETEHGH